MVFKVRVLAILVSYSVFLGLSHVYMLLNFCVISLLLICLLSLSFLDQPEEPRMAEENFFLLHSHCPEDEKSQLLRKVGDFVLNDISPTCDSRFFKQTARKTLGIYHYLLLHPHK